MMNRPYLKLHTCLLILFTCVVCLSFADDMKAYLDTTNGSSSFVVMDQQTNELMRIQSDGLMGIGTNDPATKLDVAGTISATAFSGDGSLISNLNEMDPAWITASNGMQSQLDSKIEQSDFSSATNDLWLTVDSKADQTTFTSSTVALWSAVSSEETLRQESDAALSNQVSTLDANKLNSSTWTAADSSTNYTKRTGDTMSGVLTINAGSDDDLMISTIGTNVMLGSDASSSEGGASVGYQANGESSGSALGSLANAFYNGVAMGQSANGQYDGVALGYSSEASYEGVAVGKGSLGSYYSVAIGHEAEAIGNFFGESRIAIGYGITNSMEDNSAVMRGTLYLDGGTGVMYRTSVGSGTWVNLMDDVATGTPLYVETEAIWTNAQATGFTMEGTLTINEGTYNMLDIESSGTNIAIGNGADSDLSGIAAGFNAEAVYESVAIGHGTKAGRSMPPTPGGVAIGHAANAAMNSLAIGRYANAGAFGTAQRIAIGAYVTNLVNDSAVIRGTLYLDGATGILYRSTFGSGNWQPLPTPNTAVSYTVPYEICNSNISNDWKNNTSAEDWQWNQFSVAVNGADHVSNGVIDVKLRIYGESDNGSSFYVGLRNQTDSTYPIAHTQTSLGSAGWWDSAWTTITNTTLKEFRVSAYSASASDYYYIKRAALIVRSTKALQE